MSATLALRITLPRAVPRTVASFLAPSLAPFTYLRNTSTDNLLTARQATTTPSASLGLFAYTPGGPIIQGTVNDATTFPAPSRTHGSHHWAFERLLSAALVPLTTAAFVTSGSNYPVLDGILGVSLVMHSHIGFDSCLVDYVHPRKFPVLGRVLTWTLRTATVATLVGVYQFNTNDIGLTELIAKVWTA